MNVNGVKIVFCGREDSISGSASGDTGGASERGSDDLGLNPVGKGKNRISMVKEETRRPETRITRGPPNYQKGHKKLAENVFNLAISSGEILRNLTPDR